jgi:hypothetical protein
MESNSTMTISAVEMTCADTRVWRDRLQPGARLLADVIAPVQGTTLPIVGQAVVGHTGAFYTSMDVPPFRTGRPPV